MDNEILKEQKRVLAAKMLVLRDKPPEYWALKVSKISDPIVRDKVATLVWWDYFGSRRVGERWPHLDMYLNKVHPDAEIVDQTKIEEALISCGYPHEVVKARAHWTPTDTNSYVRKSVPKIGGGGGI